MIDPTFTFFLPVKNGGEYVKQCIVSIQEQKYKNFNVIILENSSDDGTLELLQKISQKDRRFIIKPSANDLSIEDNWGRILSSNKNEFMTITGHDDYFQNNFLTEIVELIRKYPNANLYQTHFNLVDKSNKTIRQCKSIPKIESAADFIAARFAGIRDSFGTGYVMRSNLYDEVGGIPLYKDLLYSDDALWVQLMVDSFKVTSSSTAFSYRLHTNSVSGKPDRNNLYFSLYNYLCLLDDLSKKDEELKRIMKYFLSPYTGKFIQYRYYYLLKLLNRYGPEIDNELEDLKLFLKKYSPDTVLDKHFMSINRRICRNVVLWLSSKCV